MLHPRVRNTDPLTSWQAAGSAKDLASRHGCLIVDCLEKYGAMGKDGIAAQTGLDSNQVSRRLKELEEDGEISLTGQVVKSKSGRMEREWRIKPKQLELI
jgi:transcription initiation factor IIE alpha subunit